MKDKKLRDGILERGGKAGNMNVVDSDMLDMKIGEVANLAGGKDAKAVTAIKILKQASKKAQKY